MGLSDDREDPRFRPIVRAVTGTALLLTAVIVINYVSSMYHHRWDLTSTRRYSLSDATREQLDQLDQPVVMTFFPREGEGDAAGRRNRRAIRDLLNEYAARSSRLSVRILRPDQWPDRVQNLADRYGVPAKVLRNEQPVLLTREGTKRHRLVRHRQMKVVQTGGRPGTPALTVSFSRAERHLSGALFSLMRGREVTVAFTTGHGEASIQSGPETTGSMGGYQRLAGILRDREGFQVNNVEILNGIPAGTDLLVMAGPEQPVSATERKRLKGYLREGGRLLVLVEPWEDTGLNPLFSGFGLRLTDQQLMGPTRESGWMSRSMVLKHYADHPVSAPLKAANIPVYMRSIRILSKKPTSGSGDADVLLSGGPETWSEPSRASVRQRTSSPEGRARGPFPVAMAATGPAGSNQDEPPRLVVVGDVDGLNNHTIRRLQRVSESGNVSLFLNVVRWLTGLTDEIRVPPEVHHSRIILVTTGRASTIFMLLVVFLPGCLFMLGGAVWWFRRIRM